VGNILYEVTSKHRTKTSVRNAQLPVKFVSVVVKSTSLTRPSYIITASYQSQQQLAQCGDDEVGVTMAWSTFEGYNPGKIALEMATKRIGHGCSWFYFVEVFKVASWLLGSV